MKLPSPAEPLLGMSLPVGASARLTADRERFPALSRIRSY
jgi:hypothetical protein